MQRLLLTVFLVALAIRWTYSTLMFVTMGEAGLLGVDSSDYIDRGREFVGIFTANAAPDWHWLGPKPFMMPLFTWLIGAAVALAGPHAAFAYVLLQGVFDAGICILVYGIASAIHERYALPAAIAAIVNPTQIIISGLVYPDTPFAFFVALFLWGALRWWREPAWSAASIITAGLIAAVWTRALVAPFALILPLFLLAAAGIVGRLQRRHIVQLGTIAILFAVSLVPILLRNHTQYGSWALTPQGGQHLARWIVPLIWEVRDGTPWAQGYAEMERRAEALPKPPQENMFQQSDRYTRVATEALGSIDMRSIARAWIYGSVLNLATPSIALSPPVISLPRTGFYATHGTSIPDKAWNFLFRSDNVLYSWILLTGLFGVILIRLLQLAGLVEVLARGHLVAAMLLAGWCVFILLVNGPVASPKYRLPIEPVLAVMTGFGWVMFRRRIRTKI